MAAPALHHSPIASSIGKIRFCNRDRRSDFESPAPVGWSSRRYGGCPVFGKISAVSPKTNSGRLPGRRGRRACRLPDANTTDHRFRAFAGSGLRNHWKASRSKEVLCALVLAPRYFFLQSERWNYYTNPNPQGWFLNFLRRSGNLERGDVRKPSIPENNRRRSPRR
jgi:hypothetical protein